jgi:peptide/nickel transport system permease protein
MSLMIVLVGSVICALIGTTLGSLAAHVGGWVDNTIMGFADAKASVLFIVIAPGVLAFFGSNPLLFSLWAL